MFLVIKITDGEPSKGLAICIGNIILQYSYASVNSDDFIQNNFLSTTINHGREMHF